MQPDAGAGPSLRSAVPLSSHMGLTVEATGVKTAATTAVTVETTAVTAETDSHSEIIRPMIRPRPVRLVCEWPVNVSRSQTELEGPVPAPWRRQPLLVPGGKATHEPALGVAGYLSRVQRR